MTIKVLRTEEDFTNTNKKEFIKAHTLKEFTETHTLMENIMTKEIATFSGFSFRLHLTFVLISEFYSASDRIDCSEESTHTNRICRDWTLFMPFAKASGWKRLFCRNWPHPKTQDDKNDLAILFGAEEVKDPNKPDVVKEASKKGELKFHHSIWDSYETPYVIINPRDEKRGTTKKAIIQYETVPAKGKTCLTIDYMPQNGGDIDRAKCVFANLINTASKAAEEDAVGGKSSSNWGRFYLEKVQWKFGHELMKEINDKSFSQVFPKLESMFVLEALK